MPPCSAKRWMTPPAKLLIKPRNCWDWSIRAARLWPGWRPFVDALPELGEPWLVTPEAPRTLWDACFGERVVLLFGRESVGLPRELRSAWPERQIRIPMQDQGLRSLNLSTSVGVASFEVLRQWRASGGSA